MVNKDRIKNNIHQLEVLVSLLKMAEKDEISITAAGKQLNLTSQEMNRELDLCFARYFRKMKIVSSEEIDNLVKLRDLPSTRLLKDVFGYKKTEFVAFPVINENDFWKIIKNHFSDNHYKVLSMHCGYTIEKPMSFEKIAEKLKCTRMWACDMYRRSVRNFDSSVLYDIYNYEYVNKRAELESSEEHKESKKEYDTLVLYMSKVNDISSINSYISENYPEVNDLDVAKVNSLFSNSINELNISNKLLNALDRNNINTLADIYMTPAVTFKNMPNFGKIKCKELLELLSNRNDNHPNRNTLIRDLTIITS